MEEARSRVWLEDTVVVLSIAAGLSVAETAEAVGYSESWVKHRRAALMRRHGAANAAQLVLVYLADAA